MTRKNCSQPNDVIEAIASLRTRHNRIFGGDRSKNASRVVRAFASFASLWDHRLRTDWTPPTQSSFPWAQVKLSLVALLPGFTEAGDWLARSGAAKAQGDGTVVSLVLAGNTPLLGWSPLAAALLAEHAIFVKQSRDETVWTQLFVETLAEIDPELAALIHLDLWPGEDQRTVALINAADAVIAYGGDTALAALRSATPETTPFFGFGHAVSIGIATHDVADQAGQFARDILLYNQSGCLSAQALLVEEQNGIRVREVARHLAQSLEAECEALQIPPVTDPSVARLVRQARDLALFLGEDVSVVGDAALRWTIIARSSAAPLELPPGACVVQVVSLPQIEADFHDTLGAIRGYVSSVGVAGKLTAAQRETFLAEGISRVCGAGEMQMPSLDWPNGNKNLLSELMKIDRPAETDG